MNTYNVSICSSNRQLVRGSFHADPDKIDEFFDEYLGSDNASEQLLNSDVSMSNDSILIETLFDDVTKHEASMMIEELATFFGCKIDT